MATGGYRVTIGGLYVAADGNRISTRRDGRLSVAMGGHRVATR